MFLDVIIFLAGLFLALIGTIAELINSQLNLPVIQMTNAISIVFSPVFYLGGVLPVDTMLNIIGHFMGFFTGLFMFNGVVYFWSKVPFIGK